MNTVLVTGGNGYIGSHMCQLLHAHGHQVIIVDNHSTSPQTPVHKYGKFFRCEIDDHVGLAKILMEFRPSCVFHFAASALVEESEKLPWKYYRNNVIGSLELIHSCIQYGVKNFIFSSSCATYGVPAQLPITESTPQHPANSYGLSKLMVEQFLADLGRHGQLNSVALRYFNVAGSDPHLHIGENHWPETHLIPNICRAYLDGSVGDLKIFGDQHPTPDGTCIRDYVHVLDLVQGHLQALAFLQNHGGHHAFNLGSGSGSSILAVIGAFEELTSTALKYTICPARAGDPPALWADISNAQRDLGYRNQFRLIDCISHTLSYLRQFAFIQKTG